MSEQEYAQLQKDLKPAALANYGYCVKELIKELEADSSQTLAMDKFALGVQMYTSAWTDCKAQLIAALSKENQEKYDSQELQATFNRFAKLSQYREFIMSNVPTTAQDVIPTSKLALSANRLLDATKKLRVVDESIKQTEMPAPNEVKDTPM